MSRNSIREWYVQPPTDQTLQRPSASPDPFPHRPDHLIHTYTDSVDLGLPTEFAQLRKRLFHLAHAFATLPEETRETLSRADSSYLFGWSHGKEVMNGVRPLHTDSTRSIWPTRSTLLGLD